MADYTAQTWNDGAGGGTPLNATRLNTLEGGAAGSVQKSGNTGNMTGPLILEATSPTLADHATRKQYVDDQDALQLSLTGGTMTGDITLNADPTAALHASTKQYVDAGDVAASANRFDDVDVQVFTASGTWTKPTGAVRVKVECVGGGGAGGGIAAGTGGGGAGGGGAYVCKWLDASEAAATEAVTIGAGGTGGSGAGAAGGSTIFDTVASSVTAAGGSGGDSSPGAIPEHVNGGAGGVASGGDINIDGQGGGDVYVSNAGWLIYGGGGSSGKSFGSGHKTFATTSGNSSGSDGKGYGGGGGGSGAETTTTVTGGSGTDGICIVTTYTAS